MSLKGKWDARYCEFKQVVDFSGCTFRREFNSGDEVESHTIYKKDLICNGATFERTARFNGIQAEGSAYFNRASFQNRKSSIDLGGASINKTLECTKATYKGPATFDALNCSGYGIFDGAMFERDATFTFASFGATLICQGTTFKGPAGFNTVKCERGGFFCNARFQYQDNEEATQETWGADFIAASFGGNLVCTGATFEGRDLQLVGMQRTRVLRRDPSQERSGFLVRLLRRRSIVHSGHGGREIELRATEV